MSFAHWNIGKETIKQWTSFQGLILKWILNDPRGISTLTLTYVWTIFENMQCKMYSHNSLYIKHGNVNIAICFTKSRCEYFLINMFRSSCYYKFYNTMLTNILRLCTISLVKFLYFRKNCSITHFETLTENCKAE